MGYDIGNVIGNFFSLANKICLALKEKKPIVKFERIIEETYDITKEKLGIKYDGLVSFPLYCSSLSKKYYIDSVTFDSLGYAGTGIIRGTVGNSKVREITSVKENSPVSKWSLLLFGIVLIKGRNRLESCKDVLGAFRRIVN